jgi:hypothetical protein
MVWIGGPSPIWLRMLQLLGAALCAGASGRARGSRGMHSLRPRVLPNLCAAAPAARRWLSRRLRARGRTVARLLVRSRLIEIVPTP